MSNSRSPFLHALIESATQVRLRFGNSISSEGMCRDVSLATLLAVRMDQFAAVACYGKVVVAEVSHAHWWCRLEGTIVDATLDQFGDFDGVHVQPEGASSPVKYVEEFFFPVRPERILRLARPNS